MDDLNDQGLQNDGGSPAPSDTQGQEGNLNPDPSQDNTDQGAIQDLQNQLPAQDDRGVPAQNVLSEVLRKMNDMSEEIKNLRSQQYQQPKQFQEYHEPNLQQRQPQQQVIPRNAEEAARIIDAEVREKFAEKAGQPGFDAFEMLNYQNKRMMELNNLMSRNYSSMQIERSNSETRVRGFYPDLNNPQSQLSQNVVNEINRRAYMNNMSVKDYYQNNPYIFENITPMVAANMGIIPKVTNQVKIQPKPNNNLPPANLSGRQPAQRPNIEKPTQDDIAFGQRFGIKPDSLVKSRGQSDPTNFIDESNILLS